MLQAAPWKLVVCWWNGGDGGAASSLASLCQRRSHAALDFRSSPARRTFLAKVLPRRDLRWRCRVGGSEPLESSSHHKSVLYHYSKFERANLE